MLRVRSRLALALTASLTLLLQLTACHYPEGGDEWYPAEARVDSTDFRANHHYWRGFNFTLTDTLQLRSRAPFEPRFAYKADSAQLLEAGTTVIVEDIQADTTSGTSAYWIRLAAVPRVEQRALTFEPVSGWVGEGELLSHAVPDAPVSRMIYAFSSVRFKFILSLLGLALSAYLLQLVRRKRVYMVHLRDIGSPYPLALCLLVSAMAVVYQSMQHYVPHTWTEYFFHPSLNPFLPGRPLIISVFVASIWLLLVLVVAALDDVARRLDAASASLYLLGLAAVCTLLYLCFTWLVPCPWVYPLAAVYWAYALTSWAKARRSPFACGHCGRLLPSLGRCPHCGWENVDDRHEASR